MADRRIPIFSVDFEKDAEGEGGTLTVEPVGPIPDKVEFIHLSDGARYPATQDADGKVSGHIPHWSPYILGAS